jgi:hypothetical protein
LREKDLALPAQDKLREESRSAHFHKHTRFFVVPQGGTPQNDSAYEFFRSLLGLRPSSSGTDHSQKAWHGDKCGW